MRLIDADALADALFDKRKSYPKWVADVIGDMQEAVVRCKDCKHQNEYRTGSCPFYTTWGSVAPDDWFCADVERKEGR